MSFVVMSGHFSFIQSHPRKFMVFNGTFNNISRQLNIVTTQTTALGMYSVLNSRIIADWSIENMNLDMTPKWDIVRC